MKMLKRRPVIAAHGPEVTNLRDFNTKSYHGLPNLLTRGDEGKAYALLNVGRYHGARLECDASDCTLKLQQPIPHAWSLTNHGDLRGVSHEGQEFPDLPCTERGLRRLPITEAHGFISIVGNPDAEVMPDLDDWLNALGDNYRWLNLANYRISSLWWLEGSFQSGRVPGIGRFQITGRGGARTHPHDRRTKF